MYTAQLGEARFFKDASPSELNGVSTPTPPNTRRGVYEVGAGGRRVAGIWPRGSERAGHQEWR